MKTHELKIWPEFFEKVLTGTKRYEVRINDRNYERGDRLILNEWDPKAKEFTGRFCEVGVVHITYGASQPVGDLLAFNVCVMGIEVFG